MCAGFRLRRSCRLFPTPDLRQSETLVGIAATHEFLLRNIASAEQAALDRLRDVAKTVARRLRHLFQPGDFARGERGPHELRSLIVDVLNAAQKQKMCCFAET